MMLMTPMCRPAFTALWMKFIPFWSNPVGSTGSVHEICRPGLAASSPTKAWSRKLIEAWFAIAAPSMSKSSEVTPYRSITDWYSACKLAALVAATAGSVPAEPPNDMITLPPMARSACICDRTVEPSGNASLAMVPIPPHPNDQTGMVAFAFDVVVLIVLDPLSPGAKKGRPILRAGAFKIIFVPERLAVSIAQLLRAS